VEKKKHSKKRPSVDAIRRGAHKNHFPEIFIRKFAARETKKTPKKKTRQRFQGKGRVGAERGRLGFLSKPQSLQIQLLPHCKVKLRLKEKKKAIRKKAGRASKKKRTVSGAYILVVASELRVVFRKRLEIRKMQFPCEKGAAEQIDPERIRVERVFKWGVVKSRLTTTTQGES